MGMIISQMLMCEVLTTEINCSGWELNAEYEFKIWSHKVVAVHTFISERHGSSLKQGDV